ncbi:Sister chromatid cohesion protein DCC1 [Plecturocebus cupreus]
MLLFIPGCKTADQLKKEEAHCNIIHTEIFGFSNTYWELRRCRPKLKKLKKLLMENPYEGPDSQKEKDSNCSKYTTEDLLDQIQASEEEIMTQLQVLNACEIGGYWRILEFDYEMKLLNHVTQLVDSESWSFRKVPLNTCLQELGPLEPEEMIEHCLKCYGKKYVDEGEVYFELDADKICRATAHMLLQNAVKFNLAEFQEVWQQSVPEGMITSLDQLKGLALVDRHSRPEIIFLLKVDDLPEDNQGRFNSLFSLREKWTEEDIAPYIQDLCGEKQTIGALLTKYSRSSMQNEIGFHHVSQAGLELMTSSDPPSSASQSAGITDGVLPRWPGWARTPDINDPPASTSQSAGITGMSHHARPCSLYLKINTKAAVPSESFGVLEF